MGYFLDNSLAAVGLLNEWPEIIDDGLHLLSLIASAFRITMHKIVSKFLNTSLKMSTLLPIIVTDGKLRHNCQIYCIPMNADLFERTDWKPYHKSKQPSSSNIGPLQFLKWRLKSLQSNSKIQKASLIWSHWPFSMRYAVWFTVLKWSVLPPWFTSILFAIVDERKKIREAEPWEFLWEGKLREERGWVFAKHK